MGCLLACVWLTHFPDQHSDPFSGQLTDPSIGRPLINLLACVWSISLTSFLIRFLASWLIHLLASNGSSPGLIHFPDQLSGPFSGQLPDPTPGQLPHQWGRRLEGWPNTAALLAGWRRVANKQSAILYAWWTVHCPSVHTACPDGPHQFTQNTVMSYVMQGRHGLVLKWTHACLVYGYNAEAEGRRETTQHGVLLPSLAIGGWPGNCDYWIVLWCIHRQYRLPWRTVPSAWTELLIYEILGAAWLKRVRRHSMLSTLACCTAGPGSISARRSTLSRSNLLLRVHPVQEDNTLSRWRSSCFSSYCCWWNVNNKSSSLNHTWRAGHYYSLPKPFPWE